MLLLYMSINMSGGSTPNPFIENADVTSMDSVGYKFEDGDGPQQFQELSLPISTRTNEAFVIYEIDAQNYVGSGKDGKIETTFSTVEDEAFGEGTAIDQDGCFFEREMYFSRSSGQEQGFVFEGDGYRGTVIPYGSIYAYTEFDTDGSNTNGALGRLWGTSVEVTDGEMTNLLRQWPR